MSNPIRHDPTLSAIRISWLWLLLLVPILVILAVCMFARVGVHLYAEWTLAAAAWSVFFIASGSLCSTVVALCRKRPGQHADALALLFSLELILIAGSLSWLLHQWSGGRS